MIRKTLCTLLFLMLFQANYSQNPGGVAGSNLWLKADAAVDQSAGYLTGWTAQASVNSLFLK